MNRQDAEEAKERTKTHERGVLMKEPDSTLERWAHDVIGAAIEVHRTLGPGFLEQLYEEAFCLELALRQIPFTRQVSVPMTYKGHAIGDGRVDVLVSDSLIVELKAIDTLRPIHTAQIMSYLRATGHTLGLLINFNIPLLKDGIRRIILSRTN